jgi:hypothetical protein
MLSKQQIAKLKPAPFEPVFKKKLRRDENGKVVLNALNEPIYDLIPQMEYDPRTGKKVQKMKRGYYTTSQLNQIFPEQKRNKTLDELLRR